MAMKKIILAYISTWLTIEDKQVLLNKFNSPQSSIVIDNPSLHGFADSSILGSDVESIVALHKTSRLAGGDERIEESVIIVADEGVSPSSHPQTVLLVKILNEMERARSGAGVHDYETIRVLVSNASGVLTTIANGQYGWEQYWKVAQANGGHFPGE